MLAAQLYRLILQDQFIFLESRHDVPGDRSNYLSIHRTFHARQDGFSTTKVIPNAYPTSFTFYSKEALFAIPWRLMQLTLCCEFNQ